MINRSTAKTLLDVCDWSQPDNLAVEYCDLETVIFIKYAELQLACETVCEFLKSFKNFEFFGINYDVPNYCVPSLMLGIMASGHGFANLSSIPTIHENFINSLELRYSFTESQMLEGDVIRRFTIHKTQLYLIKLKQAPRKSSNNLKQNSYAYAIATSGSTGVPKTVRVTHSCIIPNIIDLKEILGAKRNDKIAQFTNFTFDPSIVEIFLALSAVGTLFMVSKSVQNDANRLLEKTYLSRVSILQMTPSLFLYSWPAERLQTTILNKNSALRALILGGEPFPKKDLFFEMKHPENTTKIYNIYGITEVSCWASVNEIDLNIASKKHYLGKLLSQTTFQVRNEMGETITRGSGFLYIGSNDRICVIDDEIGVENYESVLFRDSGDLVEIDEEGRIFYNGRSGKVIKRFGNKVDLSKLEGAILELSFVKNCYVFWDENEHKLHLCLTSPKQLTDKTDMKIAVTNRLREFESFYKPDQIHFLEYLEFTSSGKICLDFLRKKCTEKKIVNVKDMRMIEEAFKNIWMDHLSHGSNGFLRSGGTSVIALQISNAISETSNSDFPELIGMLLRDATFDECFLHIKNIISNKRGNEGFENRTHFDTIERGVISSNDYIANEQVSTTNLPLETSRKNAYQWHKCKGRIYGRFSVNLDPKSISGIQVIKKYDLQKCVDASPTLFRYSDGKSFVTVGSHSGFICTIELEQKNCSASYKVKLPDRIEASVLVFDDFRGIVGCYDGHVYCLHLKTGEIIWKYKTEDIVKCTAIFCEQRKRIFVGSYDCHVYCLSVEDGSEIWKIKASDGSITASGYLHARLQSVLFGTLNGSCLAMQQSSGKMIWRQRLKDPIFVAPLVLSNGLVLFCSVAGTLCCFDIEVNVEMWKYKINGNVFSNMIALENQSSNRETIIIASQNKGVYLFESSDGSFRTGPTLKHLLNHTSPIFATPWFESGFLFMVSTDGTLSVHSFTGKKSLRTTIKLEGEVFSSPVFDDDLLIVGSRDNNIYVVKLT